MALDPIHEGEGAETSGRLRLQVDFSLIGTPRSGVRVAMFLLGAERGRIQAGDRVALVGDTVPDYEATVIEVLSDPASVVVEFS